MGGIFYDDLVDGSSGFDVQEVNKGLVRSAVSSCTRPQRKVACLRSHCKELLTTWPPRVLPPTIRGCT